MKLSRDITLFAAGGVLGLLIDASVVQALVGAAGWNAYLARLISFCLAASFTWWWNRRFTFAGRSSGRRAHAEWLHWMALMSIGAAVNYGVYALCLAFFPALHRLPAVAAAAGSAVAALINFSAARGLLFSKPRATP
ncbi:GtrA family protein [Dyella sp.]|uniref:GtrA family protein n=1 Tax=Dyella sp. TaxID=1869338 RepID=UPI002D79D7BB|nr:GtrA family protein [Dyella sp.]HET6433965.1 GtrA family protein [Dyella sp.]